MVRHELDTGTDELQTALRGEVAAIFGLASEELADWEINRVREDGAIDAYVPIGQLDVVDIPVDPVNVRRLVGLFDDRAAEVGGTGQRDPVVVGHVADEAFYMLDGFHRHHVQTLRQETHLHATVEPNLTYEQVVKRRLEYANTHPEIEFPRQVEMVQSIWDRTPWAELIPNVVTAFRAFQDDYAFEGTEDVALIDALDEDTYQKVREWVSTVSREWGYTPAEIRENLARVENLDPDLVRLVYKKQGATPAGRINLQHAELITEAYGGEFDMQQAVAEIIIEQELTVAQTQRLLRVLEEDNPVYAEDIRETAEKIDFLGLKAKAKAATKGGRVVNRRNGSDSSNTHAQVGAVVLGEGAPRPTVLSAIRQMLPEMQDRALSGEWDAEDVRDALEISLGLAEALAQLAISASDEAAN